MNPYEILGLTEDCTIEEINKAFREKAKQFHPDKEGGDSEKFKEIKLAASVLRDPAKRTLYDESGVILEESSSMLQNKANTIFRELLGMWLNIQSGEVEVEDKEKVFLNMIIGKLNCVRFMKAVCKKNLDEMGKEKIKLDKKLKLIEKVKGNIICKAEKNIMAQMLDIEAKIISTKLSKLAEVRQSFTLVDTMIDDYEYKEEEEVASSASLNKAMLLDMLRKMPKSEEDFQPFRPFPPTPNV